MQRKNWIRLFSWIALIVFVGVMFGSAVISYMEAEAKSSAEIAKERQEKEKERQKKEKEAKGLEEEIRKLQKEIEELEDKIAEKQNEIDKTQRDLEIAIEECDIQEQHYYQRVRLMVEKGDSTYLEVLLDSKSFNDLFERMDIINAVAEYDKTLWEELKEKRQEIQDRKDLLVSQKTDLEDMKKKSEEDRNTLKKKLEENQEIRKKIEQEVAQLDKEFEKQRQIEEQAWRDAQNNQNKDTKFVGGKFMFPTNTQTITSYYGYRIHPIYGTKRFHSGVDIGARMGEAIYAANDGTVIVSGVNPGGYGNYIMVDHGGGYVTLYAHNSSNIVTVGQKVAKGQVIGYVGSTGASTGPHLHFEVRVNGSAVNPLPYVQG